MNENLVDNFNMETYSKSKKSEKELVNFYINIPFRWLAKIIVSYVHRSNITPNMISILGIFVVAVGGILLVLSDEHNSWRAIPFFISIGLFSALDGTLARKKEIFSPFGSWIGMVSERLEYMIVGLSFSWYTYSVTDDYLTMFCCILAYVFREGIATISVLTIGKMPAGWKEIYSKKFLYQNNKKIEFLVKSFFYTGTMYVILICIGIIFPSNFPLILFMVFYGLFFYLASLILIGKKVYTMKSLK